MKQKILKLAKRLNKFDIDEIELISQCDTDELEPILAELVCDNKLKKNGAIYIYTVEKQTKQKALTLPKRFQYHPKHEVDMIINCFCAAVPVLQVIKILEPEKNCITSFNRYFREVLYLRQEDELNEHFKKKPKVSCQRTFFNKIFFLYFYEDKLFVSNKNLHAKEQKKHSKDEIKKLKKNYCFINNHLDSHVYKTLIHHHISEQIWRYKKDFHFLKDDIYKLLLF